jgi:hypothetical protein
LKKGAPVKRLALLTVALILVLLPATPAFAQNSADDSQYGTGSTATNNGGKLIEVEGVIQKQGITTYMYGTHVLLDDGGTLLFVLVSEDVSLNDYVGERVTIQGTRVPGYQNGAIEGGPDLLNVSQVVEPSAGGTPPVSESRNTHHETSSGTKTHKLLTEKASVKRLLRLERT